MIEYLHEVPKAKLNGRRAGSMSTQAKREEEIKRKIIIKDAT